MFKKNVLMGMLALAFVTLAAGKVLAWDINAFDPLYGCLDPDLCSYQGHVVVTGAKGPSVVAGTIVSMEQVVPPAGPDGKPHAVAFCANPQNKIQRGISFSTDQRSFASLLPDNDCVKKGKCSVVVHQVTSTSDLPAVCI